MTPELPNSPVSSVDDDIGAATQYRYRYQATCAAIYSLLLLDEPPIIEELYCELHEDILLRKSNNMYVGIQVKTRKQGHGPFRASDSKVIDVIRKFIKLDQRFPGNFEQFILVSNCGFWNQRQNGSNLSYFLDLCKMNADETTLRGPFNRLVSKLLETAETFDSLVNVLNKVELDRIAEFDAINDKLSRAISLVEGLSYQALPDLDRMAERLVDAMVRAGSVTEETVRNIYDIIRGVDDNQVISDVILSKRVTREHVENVIRGAVEDEILLASREPFDIPETGLGTDIMVRKMTLGGLSSQNKNHLLDCKYSAERYLIELRSRRGRGMMEKILQDLTMEIQTEWVEVFDELSAVETDPFGPKLLRELRPRLRSVSDRRSNQIMAHCKYVHLLGILGILTEQCIVKWSIQSIGEVAA